jgi:hypothetical protein
MKNIDDGVLACLKPEHMWECNSDVQTNQFGSMKVVGSAEE